jgi:hypothetical protein
LCLYVVFFMSCLIVKYTINKNESGFDFVLMVSLRGLRSVKMHCSTVQVYAWFSMLRVGQKNIIFRERQYQLLRHWSY